MNWRNHKKAVYCLFTNIEYPQQKFKGNCSKALLATRRSPSSGHFKSYEIKQREANDAIDRSWMCVRGGGAVMNLVTLSNLKYCNKCYSNHLEELYWSCVLKAAPSQHLSQTHSVTNAGLRNDCSIPLHTRSLTPCCSWFYHMALVSFYRVFQLQVCSNREFSSYENVLSVRLFQRECFNFLRLAVRVF